ncbi:MAG: hypothetical protein IJO93_03795 [Clostridia bacterium]|nr:hypothetical protein [Clostridia bacterium]
MYRESVEPKKGRLSNGLLIIIAAVLIFAGQPLLVALSKAAPVYAAVFQSVFVLSLIAFCIWFYKKRLRSVTCTYITQNSELFPDLQTLPESFSQLPEGTLLVEISPGGIDGNYLAVVKESDMKAFFGKGESFELPPHTMRLNGALCSKKDACALLFEQDEQSFVLYFNPSEALANAVSRSIIKDGSI